MSSSPSVVTWHVLVLPDLLDVTRSRRTSTSRRCSGRRRAQLRFLVAFSVLLISRTLEVLFQSTSIEKEARVTNAVLYFPGFAVMLLGTLVRRWRLALAFRLVDQLVFIPQGRPSHTHFVVVPDFQEYGAMLERSLRKPSPLSFCRETSPHCVGPSGPRASKPWSSIFGWTRLCAELPLAILAADPAVVEGPDALLLDSRDDGVFEQALFLRACATSDFFCVGCRVQEIGFHASSFSFAVSWGSSLLKWAHDFSLDFSW